MMNNDIKDISFVIPGPEPEKAALISVKNSFFNNLVFSLSKLITTINLILLGHILYENKTNYQLFMIFQIGVFIIEILGKIFLFGLLKYLFYDKEENELYILFVKMKAALIILILIILIPVSIISYFIIEIILKYNFEIYDQYLIKEVYFNFILFTPLISLFEILFLLNIEFIHKINKLKVERDNYNIKAIFFYIISFLICHITLSYCLLYILEIGLIGLTLSYGLNSFIFYLCTNRYITKKQQYNSQHFFIIPNIELFDDDLMNILKENSVSSFNNLSDVIVFIFLFLVSLFTTQNQLIINIIYLNFYELLCTINRGFYFTLKNYFSKNLEDATKRKRYVIYFSLYYLILTLAIFIVLILFKNILLETYLYEGGKGKIDISMNLKIIYPIVILISNVRMALNGILRGMSVSLPSGRKAFYIIIYMILCWILCINFNYGIFGLWLSILLLNIAFVLESTHKAQIYFPEAF